MKRLTKEEIRKAVAELTVEKLRVYLAETIWEGIEEGSPEESEIYAVIEEFPSSITYDCEETRPLYHKWYDACFGETTDEDYAIILSFEEARKRYPHIFQEGDASSWDPLNRKRRSGNSLFKI